MKPNNKVLAAIQTYYFNRSRQYNVGYSSESKSGLKAERTGFKWDKDGDLDKIAEAMNKQGFSMAATSGTFWLTYKTKRIQKIVTLETNERLFPKFERSVK